MIPVYHIVVMQIFANILPTIYIYEKNNIYLTNMDNTHTIIFPNLIITILFLHAFNDALLNIDELNVKPLSF